MIPQKNIWCSPQKKIPQGNEFVRGTGQIALCIVNNLCSFTENVLFSARYGSGRTALQKRRTRMSTRPH